MSETPACYNFAIFLNQTEYGWVDVFAKKRVDPAITSLVEFLSFLVKNRILIGVLW